MKALWLLFAVAFLAGCTINPVRYVPVSVQTTTVPGYSNTVPAYPQAYGGTPDPAFSVKPSPAAPAVQYAAPVPAVPMCWDHWWRTWRPCQPATSMYFYWRR